LAPEAAQGQTASAEWGQRARLLVVVLEGLTPLAVQVLPSNPLVINDFPFRIGRESRNRGVNNDLELPDSQPFQLSRHHITIFEENGRIGIHDRGSTLGAEIDGYRFGGRGRSKGPVFFKGQGGALVLGSAESPYRFRVTVTRP
jgi:pSer/pThr/pTyr-binding forkhead associated (FHA) protein